MNHLKSSLLATAILLIPAAAFAAPDNITVVERPDAGSNTNYINSRPPLSDLALIKLPVGKIKPQGWLRKYLELQRDGLNGHLGEISAWLDKNNNQWLSDHGDHGWEEVPYWLRGYSSLAYILGNDDMIKEAGIWFDAVLNNTKADGFLGPRNFSGDKPEIWAQMVMLRALQTYYEYSADPRVPQVMSNFFKWEMNVADDHFLEGIWEKPRGGDNLWSLNWLYRINGDRSLLPLADKLHRNTSDWTMTDNLPNWHGVNVAQGFREPANYYLFKQDPALLKAAYDNHHTMRLKFGQVPGGMYGADENAREGYSDPRQGTETCAMVEQMASDQIMLQISGDPYWADHCEDVAFNSFTAAMMPDMKSLRYLTSPNMAISDEKLHGPSIDNNLRGMLSMSPFSSRCCQHNHGMGWPYYSEHLIMATPDNGIAAVLYSSCNASAKVGNGKEIGINMITDYPFDETIRLNISTGEKVSFPLYMRLPAWSHGYTLKINGDAKKLSQAKGGYLKIEREWSDGDNVELTLPMQAATRIWNSNQNSVSVDYGPLTLSLLISENITRHDSRDRDFVQDDSHWQEGVDASSWPSYVLTPASDWNYGLWIGSDNLPESLSIKKRGIVKDEVPFTNETVPLIFECKGSLIPGWGFDSTGMTDVLPDENAGHANEKQTIRLIPMGAARLRISSFPILKEKTIVTK